MPEPIRARHVIAWCAKRASDEETGKKSKTKSKERTTEGDKLINEIMDEVIMSLGKGNVDTNVFANVVCYPTVHASRSSFPRQHLAVVSYDHILEIPSIGRQRQKKRPS